MNESKQAITAIEESMKDVLTTMQGFRFYAVIENALVTALVALREKAERDNPHPLTLEELKKRHGKPVWCCAVSADCHYGCYGIVSLLDPFGNRIRIIGVPFLCEPKNYKKTWLAYANEPKEEKE